MAGWKFPGRKRRFIQLGKSSNYGWGVFQPCLITAGLILFISHCKPPLIPFISPSNKHLMKNHCEIPRSPYKTATGPLVTNYKKTTFFSHRCLVSVLKTSHPRRFSHGKNRHLLRWHWLLAVGESLWHHLAAQEPRGENAASAVVAEPRSGDVWEGKY